MRFKDINCRCGAIPHAGLYVTELDEVVKKLKENGIVCGAMSSNNAPRDELKKANKSLLSDCSSHDGIIPAVTILPPVFPDEMYNREELYQAVVEYGKVFFRMYPKSHKFIFSEWQMSWLSDFLEESSIPVLIDLEEIDVNQLAEYKKKYCSTRIILTNTTQWMNRMYIQLCRVFDNIMVDTSNMIEYMGMEIFCRELGSEKILFGTNTPCKEPYDSIFRLMYADISKEEKENIAFRNFDRVAEKQKLQIPMQNCHRFQMKLTINSNLN